MPQSVPASPLHTQIEILTLGRHSLATIRPFCTCPAVKEFNEAQNMDWRLGLHAVRQALRLPPESVVLFFSVTHFFEAKADLRTEPDWHHSGMHSANVRRILHHMGGDTMRSLAQRVRSQLQGHLQAERPLSKIFIAFCCNGGRDRSVGVSVVFENALKLCGFSKVSTRHLCQQAWRSNRGCLECAEFFANSRHPFRPCPQCQVLASRSLVEETIQGHIPQLGALARP